MSPQNNVSATQYWHLYTQTHIQAEIKLLFVWYWGPNSVPCRGWGPRASVIFNRRQCSTHVANRCDIIKKDIVYQCSLVLERKIILSESRYIWSRCVYSYTKRSPITFNTLNCNTRIALAGSCFTSFWVIQIYFKFIYNINNINDDSG